MSYTCHLLTCWQWQLTHASTKNWIIYEESWNSGKIDNVINVVWISDKIFILLKIYSIKIKHEFFIKKDFFICQSKGLLRTIREEENWRCFRMVISKIFPENYFKVLRNNTFCYRPICIKSPFLPYNSMFYSIFS